MSDLEMEDNMEMAHPLAEHDFLEDQNEMFELRKQRKNDMEKIEQNPADYINRLKVERARNAASKLIDKIKRGHDETAAETVDNIIEQEIDDHTTEQKLLNLVGDGDVNMDDGCNDFESLTANGVTFHFANVKSIVINIHK
jgi:hypothetical protein